MGFAQATHMSGRCRPLRSVSSQTYRYDIIAGFASYWYASTVRLDAAAMLATHNTHVQQLRLVGVQLPSVVLQMHRVAGAENWVVRHWCYALQSRRKVWPGYCT